MRLHRFRLFVDYPLLLEKYCDLASINETEFPDLSVVPSLEQTTSSCSEDESSLICLKSSLTIARAFRNLQSMDPCCSDSILGVGFTSGERARVQ